MTILQVKCKFCQRPIDIEIDPAYPVDRDPHKLIALAACNNCADLRDRQRRLVESLQSLCMNYAHGGRSAAEVEHTQRALTALTKAYVRLVQDWLNIPEFPWDEAMLSAFMDRPRNFSDHLRRIWIAARRFKSDQDRLL